jgi:hypothetical protein
MTKFKFKHVLSVSQGTIFPNPHLKRATSWLRKWSSGNPRFPAQLLCAAVAHENYIDAGKNI